MTHVVVLNTNTTHTTTQTRMNKTPTNPRHVANIRRDTTLMQEITYPLVPPDAPHYVCPEAEPFERTSPVMGMMVAGLSGFIVGLALPPIFEFATAIFNTTLP